MLTGSSSTHRPSSIAWIGSPRNWAISRYCAMKLSTRSDIFQRSDEKYSRVTRGLLHPDRTSAMKSA